MNTLIQAGGQAVTMTSREIAELVEQRHDNVKRTIETLATKGVVTLPQIEEVSNPGAGPKMISVYRLNKRDSLIVVAQLCPEFTARLVDRWQELESAQAKPVDPMEILRDPAQMRNLLLGYTERVLELETVVAKQTPKVEAFDRIATSDGSLCITDAAKTLQIPPRKLTQLLQENQYIYRRPMGSGWLAYQDRIQQGLMEHKITTGEKSDGSEWTGTQARITPKGLTKLAEVCRQAGLH